jgi:hypothetical protein
LRIEKEEKNSIDENSIGNTKILKFSTEKNKKMKIKRALTLKQKTHNEKVI